MKFISLIFVLAVSTPAFAAQPVDFFKKAVSEIDPQASNVRIAITYDPFKYASRVLQYVDRFAQVTIDQKRIAWAFYRVKYTPKNGLVEDCVGGIGYSLGSNPNQRSVELASCNQDFFHSTAQFEGVVDLAN